MSQVKSGLSFIAYKGIEYDKCQIKRALDNICPDDYTVKCYYQDEVVFAKVVYDEYLSDRDPFYNDNTDILSVSGYNQEGLSEVIEDFQYKYNLDDSDRYHLLMNYLYNDNQEKIFKMLRNRLDFTSVFWDKVNNRIVAGITKATKRQINLFYGYTTNNKELMFTNNRDLLESFCDDIYQMEDYTYMRDGHLYDLEGNEIKNDDITLIKKNKSNADNLIDGLNALLIQVTNDAIKEKIEDTIGNYLTDEKVKNRINSFLSTSLDLETKKKIMETVDTVFVNYDLDNSVKDKLYDTFNDALTDYSRNVSVPIVHIVRLNDLNLGQTTAGFYHEKFEQILTQTQLDEPIMLIGPAGSGKNVAVSQVADALGMHMYYTNNASNEFKLTGFIDAGGNYRDTEFYKAFKNGGVFFLDEIDNSDPSALIVINSALANGYMAFPHETIERHPDFRIIAAANTWGKGSDLQYVGRNALDAATLDRFDNIFFDYDRKLEQALYPNEEVLSFMWSFRDAIYQSKIPHVVSTRGIGKVYKKEINGLPVANILTSNIIKNLNQDDVNTIIGNMNSIDSNNKYYDGIKRLRLHR